jgi:predicted Zn-dependent protease
MTTLHSTHMCSSAWRSAVCLLLAGCSVGEPTAARGVAHLPHPDAVDRLQHRHRFAEAEKLLDTQLAARPGDPQLLLKRAQIRLLQRNARGALADCVRATPRLDALSATACRAQALGAMDQVRLARAMIEAALARTDSTPQTVSWASGIAGELAQTDGDSKRAEVWLRRSVATAGRSHYPRIAYAQFLLEQRRYDEVLGVLEGMPDASAVKALRRRALDRP